MILVAICAALFLCPAAQAGKTGRFAIPCNLQTVPAKQYNRILKERYRIGGKRPTYSSKPVSACRWRKALKTVRRARCKRSGRIVGASVYGKWGDSGTVGYRGDYLPNAGLSFAELNMGKAMGGLPYGTRIYISYGNRTVSARKLDIGGGGGSVNGYPRAIDLWHQTATALGIHGPVTALVRIRTRACK